MIGASFMLRLLLMIFLFVPLFSNTVSYAAAPARNCLWRNDLKCDLSCHAAAPTLWKGPGEGFAVSHDKKPRDLSHFSRENFLAGAAASYAYKPLRAYYKMSLPQHAKPLIILDPGHGGTDEGAKIHYFMEKRLTLMTTLLVRKYLEEMGYRVIMTRSKDVFISLPRRVSIANKTKAVLFTSIHYNSSPSPDAHGIEVFYHSGSDAKRLKESRKLATSVLGELLSETSAYSRGVKHGNFHVIRETTMPAILVEGGFMTNYEERTSLRDKRYLEKIAKGIAQGIDKYLKL